MKSKMTEFQLNMKVWDESDNILFVLSTLLIFRIIVFQLFKINNNTMDHAMDQHAQNSN